MNMNCPLSEFGQGVFFVGGAEAGVHRRCVPEGTRTQISTERWMASAVKQYGISADRKVLRDRLFGGIIKIYISWRNEYASCNIDSCMFCRLDCVLYC